MTKIAKVKYNDTVNGEGVCVSLFTQGCPHRCPGCWNPETWDFGGGYSVPADFKQKLVNSIVANGIQRNFSILGGEPLCSQNRDFVNEIVTEIRNSYPHIKIFLWTGYTLEKLQNENNPVVNSILKKCDILIDGPFDISKRDITLKLRGSSNQRIIDLKKIF